MEQKLCPKCQTPIIETNYFCPNCGYKIKEPPVSTTIGKQIGIYLLSALLPPLGLWPAIKYLRQPDSKAQMIGLVAVVLTVVSIIISLWLSFVVFNNLTSTLNAQLDGTGLGL